jgi:hypothetical protein
MVVFDAGKIPPRTPRHKFHGSCIAQHVRHSQATALGSVGYHGMIHDRQVLSELVTPKGNSCSSTAAVTATE